MSLKHGLLSKLPAVLFVAILTCSMGANTARGRMPSQALASAGTVPQISSVKPASVTPGSTLNLKIGGKNFSGGTRAAFQNPGIHVLGVEVKKSSEMEVRIKVDSNAATGSTTLFIFNPDDSEAEASFAVATGSPVVEGSDLPGASTQTKPSGSTGSPAATPSQQFEVINLGDLGGLLKGAGAKPKGTLSIAKGKLTYTENGQEVFSVSASDIREIDLNQFLGINTGTFHVILNSGKAYNFAASSLRPADGQAMVTSLHQALK